MGSEMCIRDSRWGGTRSLFLRARAHKNAPLHRRRGDPAREEGEGGREGGPAGLPPARPRRAPGRCPTAAGMAATGGAHCREPAGHTRLLLALPAHLQLHKHPTEHARPSPHFPGHTVSSPLLALRSNTAEKHGSSTRWICTELPPPVRPPCSCISSARFSLPRASASPHPHYRCSPLNGRC